MSKIDYIQGFNYADEILSNANPLEVVISGQKDWQKVTARSLIDTAERRIASCTNIDYQKGVIDRAREELE